jgi:hypothetical protein
LRNLVRFALTIGAVALFAGCRGLEPPIGELGATTQTSTIATHAERGKSWMLPGTSSGSDLLYLAAHTGGLYVLTYPQGELVGEVSLPYAPSSGGICSDANGDIFVPDGSEIVEYAHGGTQPIATLKDGIGFPSYANGCAVDPTTGNLAVTNDGGPYQGNVAIYTDAQGDPTYYSDSSLYEPLFCGYDNRGNLFVDAGRPFAELPSGAQTFTDIKLPHDVIGGEVQWDGKHITVESYRANAIYRIKTAGSTGRVIGTTHLQDQGGKAFPQSWIQGSTLIAPIGLSRADDRVGFWNYPRGGKAFTIVRLGSHADLAGATVSVAPTR